MADKTIVVRAVYRSNVAQGMSQDASAVMQYSAAVESGTSRVINRTKALGAASAVAGKLLVLGVGGAMAVSAKAAIDFESSMAGVAKTTDLAGNSFDRASGPLFAMGEALRQLSLRTPLNVNELADIAALGGQLGIQTENLVEFTEVMAALGVSTNLSSTEAATAFARFVNIMGSGQDDFERLGSIVVELGNNFATTEQEILHFGMRIAPIGQTVGATEEEVFALSAALTSLGIPAERGGTAIQKWMILAKQATDQGTESLAGFADVAGMTTDEFRRLFQESPGRAFEAFVKGLDQMNQAGQDVFGTLEALQLGEVRTTQVLLASAGGWETVADAMDTAFQEGKEGNALFEEAARRYGTTASQIQLLANSFNDLKIEIGNALLSSGGLAFAIDVVREFFTIIKDNLGTLRTFATVIGVLLTIRAGIWFMELGQKAVAAAKSIYQVQAAAQATNTTSRIMTGSMALLTGAMQGALAVAGALATVWMLQAIKAAELRAKIRGLREEIEQGADPVEALGDEIREMVSDKNRRLLEAAGLSIEDVVQAAMRGRGAVRELFEGTDLPIDVARQLNRDFSEAIGVVEGFRDVLAGDLVNAYIESGNAAHLSTEEMREAADRAIQMFGYDISEGEFVNSIYRFLDTLPGRFRSSFTEAFRVTGTGMNIAEMEWEDFLPTGERENIMEDFFDDNMAAAENFKTRMADEFSEIGEIVREGMPVWEEYHKAVLGSEETLSFDAALKAQEAFLEDTRDWVERMPDIMDMGASSDTVAWIDSLSAPVRGAIGRLNDTQLQELIDGANRNFDELHKLHLERWMQLYPENASLAFGAMVGELAGRVDEMNLPGEASGEAFMEGLMDIMAQLPEEDQAQFLTYLSEIFPDTQWLAENGITMGDDILTGFLTSLAGWPSELRAAVIKAVNAGIKTPIEDTFDIKSPSRWMRDRGNMLMEGFALGIKDQLGSIAQMFRPELLMPAMNPSTGSMSTVNNSRQSTYNLTVNGGGNGQNIRAESQTLLTLLTIVGGVEAGAGR